MRIEKLRLKGFIGIQKGLGLNEISIDFSGIVGLVAFAGQNGAGKSTILENMHPYNQLASRDGALYRHCFLRDSEKELSFTYDRHHYKTLLKIDCESGKSEGYIWKDGQSEVNGKISAYAEYIKSLLGSPALFFASVFCAQGSKKLSDMTTGQLKGLFAEFLRLDRLTAYEETAKQCSNVLSGSVIQLDSRAQHLADAISAKLDLQNESVTAELQMSDLYARRDTLRHQVFTLTNRIDELKEVSAQNAVNIERRVDLENSAKRLTETLAADQVSCSNELSVLRAEYEEIKTALRLIDETLKQRDAIIGAAAKETELTATIDGLTIELEKLTEQGAAHQELIHAMENSRRDLEASIQALNADEKLKEIKDNITATRNLVNAQEVEIKIIETDPRVSALESEIKSLTEKAEILAVKDPACQSTTCAFIVNALEAAEKLPVARKELAAAKVSQAERRAAAREKLDTLVQSYNNLIVQETDRLVWVDDKKTDIKETIDDACRAIKAESALFVARNNDIATLRQRVADAKADLDQQKKLSALLPQVQVAEQRKADFEKRKQEITDKGVAIKSAYDLKELDTQELIAGTRNAIAEVSAKIYMGVEGRMKSYLGEKQALEQMLIPEAEKDIQELRDKLSKIQGEISRLEDAEKELITVQYDREQVTREISEWTYLRNACSKNGLQALEIDGAAPLITSFANDLLSQAFGPLYTVRLRTQDDEGREVLDIVTIGEDGSEVLLENLSGGQRVWVLMALRLAMTLLSKEKSGRNFETAFFDELDGALDPDNALNFISMYQSFMKTGGFKMIPFISHKPECRNLADNVLQFEHGKNPVWG